MTIVHAFSRFLFVSCGVFLAPPKVVSHFKSRATTPRETTSLLPLRLFLLHYRTPRAQPTTVDQKSMRASSPPRSRRSHRGLKRGVPRSCAAPLLLLAAWLGGCVAGGVSGSVAVGAVVTYLWQTPPDPLTPPPSPPPAPPQTQPVRCGEPGRCSGETEGLRDTNELHAVGA